MQHALTFTTAGFKRLHHKVLLTRLQAPGWPDVTCAAYLHLTLSNSVCPSTDTAVLTNTVAKLQQLQSLQAQHCNTIPERRLRVTQDGAAQQGQWGNKEIKEDGRGMWRCYGTFACLTSFFGPFLWFFHQVAISKWRNLIPDHYKMTISYLIISMQ